MARSARFNISAVGDLLEQLRYAPAQTRRRDLEAAEVFLNEIEAGRNYPEDYVVFRITSYRPETREGPAMLIGEALLRDIGIFIERLSQSLSLTVDDYEPRKALTPAEARKRLGVSATTLHRYRKAGLAAHQIVWEDGVMRLGFLEDSIEQFEAAHWERVGRARRVEHLSEDRKAEIVRRARRYHETMGYSVYEAAKRLGPRFGRSAEAVRQMLKRHDGRDPGGAIYLDRGPMVARDRAVLLRAHDFGVPMRVLVERFGRARPTLYRLIHQGRLERIRKWPIDCVELPTFGIEGAGEVLLSSGHVSGGFARGGVLEFGGSAEEWIGRAEAVKEGLVSEEEEMAWFGALNFLLCSVARERETVDRNHPSAGQVDVLETRLRWALRLKARIVFAHLDEVLSTLEIHMGRSIREARREEVRRLHRIGMATVFRTVERFDPSRGQRFAALLSLNLRRRLAQVGSSGSDADETGESPTRAKAKVRWVDQRDGGGGLVLVLEERAEWFYPWRGCLDFSAARVAVIESKLEEAKARVLRLRYGMDGERPMSFAETGSRLGMSGEEAAATEYRAKRWLRRWGAGVARVRRA